MKQRKLVSITILGILISVMVTSLAWAALKDNVRNLSQSYKFGTSAGVPAIALSQNNQNIGIVWTERRSSSEAIQGPIYFRGGTLGENNKGFYKPKIIVDSSNSVNDQSSQAAIASNPKTVGGMEIVWLNLFQQQTNRILHKLCTITPTVTQCDTTETILETSNNALSGPAIAANPNNATAVGLHLIWDQSIDSNTRHIKYKGRDNNGVWQTTSQEVSGIDTANRRASRSAIATSTLNGTTYVHVVWVEDINPADGLEINDDVKYRRGVVGSDGLVATWGPIITLPKPTINIGSPASNPDYPKVEAIGDTVVALWDLFAGSETSFTNALLENYYAVYSVSTNGGSSFGTVRDVGSGTNSTIGFTLRRSDDDPGSGTPTLHNSSIHARRLQIEASFVPTTTVGITGTLHVVWHQTTNPDSTFRYHDVRYNSLQINTTCRNNCTVWSDGAAGFNETAGRKIVAERGDEEAYSASPDIVGGTDSNLHIVYMQSNEASGFDVKDVEYDTLFNSTQDLPAVDNPGPVFLPVILRS